MRRAHLRRVLATLVVLAIPVAANWVSAGVLDRLIDSLVDRNLRSTSFEPDKAQQDGVQTRGSHGVNVDHVIRRLSVAHVAAVRLGTLFTDPRLTVDLTVLGDEADALEQKVRSVMSLMRHANNTPGVVVHAGDTSALIRAALQRQRVPAYVGREVDDPLEHAFAVTGYRPRSPCTLIVRAWLPHGGA